MSSEFFQRSPSTVCLSTDPNTQIFVLSFMATLVQFQDAKNCLHIWRIGYRFEILFVRWRSRRRQCFEFDLIRFDGWLKSVESSMGTIHHTCFRKMAARYSNIVCDPAFIPWAQPAEVSHFQGWWRVLKEPGGTNAIMDLELKEENMEKFLMFIQYTVYVVVEWNLDSIDSRCRSSWRSLGLKWRTASCEYVITYTSYDSLDLCIWEFQSDAARPSFRVFAGTDIWSKAKTVKLLYRAAVQNCNASRDSLRDGKSNVCSCPFFFVCFVMFCGYLYLGQLGAFVDGGIVYFCDENPKCQVIWGGQGTLMRTDEEDFMRRWTPVVRQLAGPARTGWENRSMKMSKLHR